MHSLTNVEVPANAVAIHWFEQSCFAIKDASGTIIQIDPFFPHERLPERFIHDTPPLDESLLPTDYVLLTHDHRDHTCPESLRRIHETFPHVRVIGPAESTRRVAEETEIAAANVTTIQAGDAVNLVSMTAHAVYAKPPEGDPSMEIPPPDVTHLGYIIKTTGPTLYFSGDPINNFADQDALIKAIAAHQPDIGFLTTHPSEGEFPFFDGSVKMAERIGLQHAVPAHYACFVKRDYDPQAWAASFPTLSDNADDSSFYQGPVPILIERDTHIIYPTAELSATESSAS